MKAAETSASTATAAWTPLTVVSRSRTTAEIETFIRDVSTTKTNIAIANSRLRRRPCLAVSDTPSSSGGAARSTSGAGQDPLLLALELSIRQGPFAAQRAQ